MDEGAQARRIVEVDPTSDHGRDLVVKLMLAQRRLESIASPNLLGIREIGIRERTVIVTTDSISGVRLDAEYRDRSPALTYRIIEDVARAIEPLHDDVRAPLHIGHGRLRPSCVWLDDAARVFVSGALVDRLIADHRAPVEERSDWHQLMQIAATLLPAESKSARDIAAQAENVGGLDDVLEACRRAMLHTPAAIFDVGFIGDVPLGHVALRPATVAIKPTLTGDRTRPRKGTNAETEVASFIAEPTEVLDFVDGYVITARLGSGAYAEVFEGVQLSNDQRVALKILKAEYRTIDVAGTRMKREAEVLAKVRHPNVVRLIEVCNTSDGRPCIVVELLTGSTLRERIDAVGALPIEQTQEFGGQMAAALAALHAEDFVHRDVKPHNMVFSDEGATPALKLLDLGIARFPLMSERTRLTGTGDVIGSPAYMAPEQVRGEIVGAAADVYSLGVSLYLMMTGALPFKGEVEQVMAAQCISPVPVVAALEPLTPLVLAMMAKSPDERPSAAEVEQALTTFGGHTVTLEGPTPDTRVLPGRGPTVVTVTRPRRMAASVAGLLAVTVGTAWVWSSRTTPDVASPLDLPERTPTIVQSVVAVPKTSTSASPPAESEPSGTRVEVRPDKIAPITPPRTRRPKRRNEPRRRAIRELQLLGIRVSDLVTLQERGIPAAGQLMQILNDDGDAQIPIAPNVLVRELRREDVMRIVADRRLDGILPKLRQLATHPDTNVRALEAEYFELRKERMRGSPKMSSLLRRAGDLDQRVAAALEALGT